MNKIEEHIKRLFKDIPESRHKAEIIQEVTQNLNEEVADLISQGESEDQAVKKAIDDFGDITDIKKELLSSIRTEKSNKLGLSLAFSVWGAVLITAFFVFINMYYSPHIIWFVYPVFAIIWWPMSMLFHWLHVKDGRPTGLSYSICSFVLIMGLLIFINFYCSPHTIWFVYPAFGLIWWPMSMLFHSLRQKNRKDD